MKKILRLVTTSVLTLTLVACGEASSSVSTGTTTSPSVPSVSSAYANVTSLTLSAASNLLTQTLGSQTTVTITGALNANTNPSIQLEWFVNGVKQLQTGRVFDFTPTSAGAFVVTARAGNVVSNSLNFTVGLPTIGITKTEFVTARTLHVNADAGAQVSVVGATLAADSFYDLNTKKYVLNFEQPVEQGSSITLRLERPGFGVATQTVLFDTGEFTLDAVKLNSGRPLSVVNGVYQIVKPFDEGNLFAKVYEINFNQKNILTKTKPQELKSELAVPATATAVNPSSELITELGSKQFTVNSDTVAGLYTHKFTLRGKVLEVKVQVVEPTPTIEINDQAYEYSENFDEATGDLIKFGVAVQLNTVGSGDSFVSTAFRPASVDATGAFVVTRPFDTDVKADKLFVNFNALNLASDEFVANTYTVNLKGPSINAATIVSLSGGIEVLNTTQAAANSTDLLTTNLLAPFNGSALTTGGAQATSANGVITQFFDRTSPLGTYTFTVSAGKAGSETTKDIVVKLVAPTPEISFYITKTNSAETAALRNHVVEVQGDTYTIEKPFNLTSPINFEWFAIVKNYQSALETDINKISSNTVELNYSRRELFTFADGVKKDLGSGEVLSDATFLVDVNSQNNVLKVNVANLLGLSATPLTQALIDTVAKYKVTRSALTGITGTITSATAASTPAFETLPSSGEIIIDSDLDLTNVPVGSLVTYTLELFTTADAPVGASIELKARATTFANVAEVGAGLLTNSAATDLYGFNSAAYKFVNMGMSVVGPASLINPIPQTKSAILLGADKNAFLLVDQTVESNLQVNALNALYGSAFAPQLDVASSANLNTSTLDNAGNNRSALSIDSNTVAGTYTLTFVVDGLEKVVNLVIKNSTPKLFVLNTVNVPAAPTAITFGSENDSTRPFLTSGVNSNKIKYYNFVANTTAYDAGDKYISEVNGVYTLSLPTDYATIQASAIATDPKYVLVAPITIVDMPKGTYNYRISKSYPDGRNEVFQDTVSIVDLDKNQMAIFGTNAKFTDNFKINEAGFELGQYRFEFTVGTVSKTVVINVVEQSGFNVESVSVGNETATLFNGKYLLTVPSVMPTTSQPSAIQIDVSRLGVQDGDYYEIVSLGKTGAFVLANSPTLAKLEVVDGVILLDLGTLSGTIATTNDITLTLRFYKKINFVDHMALVRQSVRSTFITAVTAAKAGYVQIGADQVVIIKFLTA